jgi:hypothetical protein
MRSRAKLTKEDQMKTCLITLIAIAAVFAPSEGSAQVYDYQSVPNTQVNLVQNGSFESSSLSPWGQSDVGLWLGFPDAADGRNYAGIGGYLYQDIPTTAGQTYELQFAMAGNANWPGLITMNTLWGGNTVNITTWNPTGHNVNNLGWIYVDMNVTANSSMTRLEFDNPGQINQQPFLDAVGLFAVPEPSPSMFMVSFGILVLFGKWWRRQPAA